MAATPVEVVRAVFEAFVSGDLVALRGYVDPDLEWTFLDPTEADPTPRTCSGRAELEAAAGRWAESGLRGTLEEVDAIGDRVRVVMYVPGLDATRALDR
jgi:ketosteroid isomerase-like protein